jgi:hypothetical protein
MSIIKISYLSDVFLTIVFSVNHIWPQAMSKLILSTINGDFVNYFSISLKNH